MSFLVDKLPISAIQGGVGLRNGLLGASAGLTGDPRVVQALQEAQRTAQNDPNNMLRALQDPRFGARLGFPIDKLPTVAGGPTTSMARVPQTSQLLLAQALQQAVQDPTTARDVLGITPSPQEAASRLRATLEALGGMGGMGTPGGAGMPGGVGGGLQGILAGMRPHFSIDPQTGKSNMTLSTQDFSATEFASRGDAQQALDVLKSGGGNGTLSQQPNGIWRLSVLVPALGGGASAGGRKGAPTEQQVRTTLEKLRTAFANDSSLAQSSAHRSMWNAYAGLAGDVPQLEEIIDSEGLYSPEMELDWLASREIEAALDADPLSEGAPAGAPTTPQGARMPTGTSRTSTPAPNSRSNTSTPSTAR